jgi:hypothetical protein
MASEAIGECHRTAVHNPRPARHVQSLQATVEKLLEKLPSASPR